MTGKFEVQNPDGSISQIKRTKKFQFEKTDLFKGKDRVKWIDNCTYQLIPLKIVDDSGMVGPEILTIQIVMIGEHHYVFKATGIGDSVIPGKVYEKGFLEYDKK